MSKVFKNKNFLQLLSDSNKKIQKILVQSASNEQIKAICEMSLDLLKGNLNLDEIELKKLHKKRKILRNLVKKQSNKKRKYLIQKVGFLQILIPAIVSGLASVLSSVIGNETRTKVGSSSI